MNPELLVSAAYAAAAIAGDSPPVWLLVLLVVLGGGGAGVFVNAFANRKKNSADTVKAIQEAAGGMLDQYKADNDRLRVEVDKLEGEVETEKKERRECERVLRERIRKMEDYLADQNRILQEHVGWDIMAIRRLRDMGIVLPDAPPLKPAAPPPHE